MLNYTWCPWKCKVRRTMESLFVTKIGIFKPREKWIPHFKSFKILKSLSHDSLAWMRTFWAERSRAGWDWELRMAVWRLGLMRRGYWWKHLWSEENHSAMKNPSPSGAGHHLYSSGWNTTLSCQGGTSSSPLNLVCLHFPVGTFLLVPQPWNTNLKENLKNFS